MATRRTFTLGAWRLASLGAFLYAEQLRELITCNQRRARLAAIFTGNCWRQSLATNVSGNCWR
jgi:hypothetical protein